MSEITCAMKAVTHGCVSFEKEEPCPRCDYQLHKIYDDIKCLCDGMTDSETGFMKVHEVPWDTCKQIYKLMRSTETSSAIERANEEPKL